MNIDIWTMKITCVSGWYLEDDASKICVIESSTTLDELSRFILSAFNFDDDHCHSFFMSRNSRNNRKNTIDDEEMMLTNVFPIGNSNFLFMLFDFGDNWVFKINKTRKNTKKITDLLYPRVIENIGNNPIQYPGCSDE